MIEQYQDIIDNCEAYLGALQHLYVESNDTPPGRMISQLKWLCQEIQCERLVLPLDRQYYSTLSHVFVEHADIMLVATPLAKVYHKRLLNLLDNRLLVKPEYSHIVLPLLDYLIDRFDKDETIYKNKLTELRSLVESSITLFPISRGAFRILELSFFDSLQLKGIHNGIQTMEMIIEFCFEGVRDLENSPYIICQCCHVEKPDIIKQRKR